MELYEKYKTLFNGYYVNTPLRIAHFMGQIDAESGLKSVREGLYYKTIKSLRDTFYTPFKGKSNEFVSQYLKNPIKCANYVYANRGGNGDEASGDGYFFRGGGLIQQTFRNGYLKLSKDTKIDFVGNPDLILEEANSIISALEYWKNNKLNQYADKDDLDSISDIINIGRVTQKKCDANGYEHRKKCVNKWKAKLLIK
jgi:putative chitinase